MINAPDILNARILIVDDQETNVALLEQLLADNGYTAVTSTMLPAEVCALHRKDPYDLILLDLQMPVMVHSRSSVVHYELSFFEKRNQAIFMRRKRRSGAARITSAR